MKEKNDYNATILLISIGNEMYDNLVEGATKKMLEKLTRGKMIDQLY
jgi:hypothetical protein